MSLVVPNPGTSYSLAQQNGPFSFLAPTAWDSSAFQCYGVNVVGPGIQDTSKNPDPSPNLAALTAGVSSCAYRGIVSKPFTFSAAFPEVTVDLQVPPGAGRVIQLIGITNAAFCGSSFTGDGGAGAYEIGHVVTDVFGDVTVSIPVTYAASESRRVDCGSSGSASAATVAPSVGAFTVTNANPTNSSIFSLSYAGVMGLYDQYCILEGNTNIGSCSWVTGALPSTFVVSGSDGAKPLSLWIKNTSAGLTSAISNSNTVSLDQTAPAIASATITTTGPTNLPTVALSYGTVTGTYSQYCIKENDDVTPAVAAACWMTGTLPSTYAIATDGVKTLYVWLKDAAGNISGYVYTGSITIDRVLPALTVALSGGGTYQAGNSISVTWTSSKTLVATSAELSTDGGTTFSAAGTGLTGGYWIWTVGDTPAFVNQAVMRLTSIDVAGNVAQVVSSGFTILGSPATFAFIAPNASPDQFGCNPYTLELRDSLGRPVPQLVSARAVNLSILSGLTGSFYASSDPNCLTPSATLSLATGQSTLSFQFMPTTAVAGVFQATSSTPTTLAAPTTPASPVARLYWDAGTSANAPINSRSYHTSLVAGSKVIIWGGDESGVPQGPAAYFDMTTNTWTAMTLTNAPAARSEHSAVWTGAKMIVWGGRNTSLTAINTGGIYNPSTDTWTTMTTTGAPTARMGHVAFWDATAARMFVFGGCIATFVTCYNDVYAYDPSTDTWANQSPTGTAPTGRAYVGYAVTSTRKLVIYGGQTGVSSDAANGARYDIASNAWLTLATGPFSASHSIGAVSVGPTQIFFSGGMSYSGSYFATSRVYDSASDTWATTPAGTAPSARAMNTLVYDGSNRVISWAGDVGGVTNTGAVFEVAGNIWRTPTSTTNVPPARSLATAVWDAVNARMLVWGGYGVTGAQPVYTFYK